MNQHDFLFELFTEELPPKALKKLSESLETAVTQGLVEAELAFKAITSYATPRRLAFMISQLAETQPMQKIERKGPAIKQAYDADGNPTPACIGFAKSCGIPLEDIRSINTTKSDKGEWLYYQGEKAGKSVIELIPEIIKKALKQLPIPKPMYWGAHKEAFVRPVHAVTMLYGEQIIDTRLFGIQSDRVTHGHRFMSKQEITLSFPSDYESQLEKQGFVIADFEQRKNIIFENLQASIKQKFNDTATAVITPELLDEVTALVEWPNVLICSFDQNFLTVPKEALISSMQDHQKCFAIIDKQSQKLLPYFITVSNLSSKDVSQVIHGNECVMRARLSDAKFFYETDKQHKLDSHIENLKLVTYQETLGSVHDKTQRVKNLITRLISNAEVNLNLELDTALAQRAAELCKTDLLTQMVGEFPELQGIMGQYYALNDNEDEQVAIAIREHYQPRNAQDDLPETDLGKLLAIADRMDTLAGIFAINKLPTGDKDPFALRRAALGILKIILDKQINLDLLTLIKLAIEQFDSSQILNQNLEQNLLQFFYDRLKALLLENNITHDVFQSVIKLNITQAADALTRMQAVQAFKNLEQASALASANKRVGNLLNKNQTDLDNTQVNLDLFEKEIENKLYQAILTKADNTKKLLAQKNYAELLTCLADLKPLVDEFFAEVMVMAEDQAVRENRLVLLSKLRELFLQVADIAELQ